MLCIFCYFTLCITFNVDVEPTMEMKESPRWEEIQFPDFLDDYSVSKSFTASGPPQRGGSYTLEHQQGLTGAKVANEPSGKREGTPLKRVRRASTSRAPDAGLERLVTAAEKTNSLLETFLSQNDDLIAAFKNS
jgi:hypothetical protein